MDLKTIATIALLAISMVTAKAQSAEDVGTRQETIVEHINSNSDSIISIIQPKAMDERISPTFEGNIESKDVDDNQSKGSGTKSRVGGYRIQAFSDNNAHTAKDEAQTRARNIASRFPYRTYVVYNSPYWRLKVGDFRTEEDAREALQELKRAFPVYGREMRIVRDWVTIIE